MAYNNFYPATYQPMYNAYQYQAPQQAQNNSIIWVSGEAGAKAYLVAPNTTVQLWDSESQRIFLKSADASGMPSMKVLKYTIEGDSSPSVVGGSVDMSESVKGEIDALRCEVDTIKGELEKIKEAAK